MDLTPVGWERNSTTSFIYQQRLLRLSFRVYSTGKGEKVSKRWTSKLSSIRYYTFNPGPPGQDDQITCIIHTPWNKCLYPCWKDLLIAFHFAVMCLVKTSATNPSASTRTRRAVELVILRSVEIWWRRNKFGTWRDLFFERSPQRSWTAIFSLLLIIF